MGYSEEEKRVFCSLLDQSRLFGVAGTRVIRAAVLGNTLPDRDFESLMNALKVEQNLMAIIDQRAHDVIQKLKQKSKNKSSI